jgi:hypothetical protein
MFRPLLFAALIPCAWLAAEPAPSALLLPGPALAVPAPVALAAEPFETARAHLQAGRVDEAEAAALLELASRPYDALGYALLHQIAVAREDVAGQLRWLKWLYWSQKYSGQAKPAAETAAQLTALWDGWNRDEAIVDAWSDGVLKAAKSAAGKKQYRLAGHLLTKLMELNPTDASLEREWDALVKKAGQEVSGGGFQAAEVRRKSASWIAKQNAKHEEWENRFQEKSRYYDVETNLDYEFFMTLQSAMDEIYEFYQEVYDYKKKTPRVLLAVHRKRSDFDRFSQEAIGRALPSESVGGYWVPGGNIVAAYDRSYGDPDVSREDLWNTLFHESSHQFMTILTDKLQKRGVYTPAWLDEGTASYFEGCQIKADGTIVKNNVAEHRLREWWWLEHSDKRNSLEDLVAHERNTGPDSTGLLSYEGEFYSYGWALVYFLLNYEENDRRVYGTPITPGQSIPAEYKSVRKAGRLVYREPYLKYLEFYSTEGNKKNDRNQPFEKAKELFVDAVADPDVPNWEAFENRWRKFTNSLYGELQSGYEFADVLQARSRGYVLAGDFERARITAEQADAKRPEDPETFRLLAEANFGAKREGEAAYWMFRHWEKLWPTGDEAALQAAEAWLNDNGLKDVVKNVCDLSRLARAQVEAAMEDALGAGHPVMAALWAAHLQRALGVEFEELNRQAAELAELSGQDLRMWQAAFNKGPEGNRRIQLSEGSRDMITAVEYKPEGVLIYDPAGRDTPGYERCDEGSLSWLAPPYDVRGQVEVDGKAGRLLLGLDRNGRPRLWLTFEHPREGSNAVGLWTVDQQTDVDSGVVYVRPDQVGGGYLASEGKQFKFEFTMSLDSEGAPVCKLKVDDEDVEVPAKEFSLRRLTGGLALAVTDDTAALFTDLEVRPNRAFWPVAPD